MDTVGSHQQCISFRVDNLSFSLAAVRLDVDLIDGLELCEGICTGLGG